MTTFGQRLDAVIKARGITAYRLGQLCGMRRDRIYKNIKDQEWPRRGTIEKYAAALEIDKDILTGSKPFPSEWEQFIEDDNDDEDDVDTDGKSKFLKRQMDTAPGIVGRANWAVCLQVVGEHAGKRCVTSFSPRKRQQARECLEQELKRAYDEVRFVVRYVSRG